MTKYEKMLIANKEANQEKFSTVKDEIRKMLDSNIPVTATELAKRTGCSRGYLYSNKSVRSVWEEAMSLQNGKCIRKETKEIFDKAMDKQLKLYEGKIEKLTKENETLKKENEVLKKALAKKDLKDYRNL